MATRKRTNQISGKHQSPRIILSQDRDQPDQFGRWRQAAKRRGWNLTQLIRTAVEEYLKK